MLPSVIGPGAQAIETSAALWTALAVEYVEVLILPLAGDVRDVGAEKDEVDQISVIPASTRAHASVLGRSGRVSSSPPPDRDF